MTTLLHKRGKGVPSVDAFHSVGEILIDTETGTAYTLTDAGDVVEVAGNVVDKGPAYRYQVYDMGAWGAPTNAGEVILPTNVPCYSDEFSFYETDLDGVSLPDMKAGDIIELINDRDEMSRYTIVGFDDYKTKVAWLDGEEWNGVRGENIPNDFYFYEGNSSTRAAASAIRAANNALAKTLTTLDNSIQDQTTIEGMRDALSGAISGIVEQIVGKPKK